MLRYFLEHPHQLVAKEELMAAAWPGAKVVKAVLRVSIQEIREVLGDKAGNPQVIETVGKKGYRSIARVSFRLPEAGGEFYLSFVGSQAELERLQRHLAQARSGRRQVVFITGERRTRPSARASGIGRKLRREQ
jgi:DNA-binding winged helix-turn-helix (wHTH) protein